MRVLAAVDRSGTAAVVAPEQEEALKYETMA